MSLQHLSMVVAAGLLLPAPAGAASQSHAQTSARIYHTAGVGIDQRRAALRVAADTLAAAGVIVAWKDCADGCTEVPDAGELVVRLVRSPAATRPGDRLVLGDAYVDVSRAAGVLATIYVDRVERLAEASGTDMVTLLGRAIAHELGHLLLASNTHSPHGLMRARWSHEDLRRERLADWLFTQKDAAAMRRRLR